MEFMLWVGNINKNVAFYDGRRQFFRLAIFTNFLLYEPCVRGKSRINDFGQNYRYHRRIGCIKLILKLFSFNDELEMAQVSDAEIYLF
jgi:hypothetical protein